MSDKVNFPEVGAIAQTIKHQIRAGTAWNGLTPAAKEALDQIATCIARIVSSDGMHWDGIMAYADSAKPEAEPAKPTSAQRIGMEAIERAVREIPARNSHD